MTGRTMKLTPDTKFLIEKMGIRIKRARLRRNIMAETLAEQIGISKGTLSAVEKGSPTVSIGTYAAVLSALDMVNDLEFVAVDREGKKNYQELNLYQRKRATRKKV